MARVKRAVHAKKSHKKVLDRAKGYKGARSRRYKTANEQVMHASQEAYRYRRARKRAPGPPSQRQPVRPRGPRNRRVVPAAGLHHSRERHDAGTPLLEGPNLL